MAAFTREVGSTNVYIGVFIPDATVSTGAGLANVSSATVSLSWWRNNMSTVSTQTLTTGTLGTWATSSMVQMSSTLALGWYGVSLPDGMFASGNNSIAHIYGAANMAPVPINFDLTTHTAQSVINPVGASTITVGVNASSITGGVNVSSIVGSAAVTTSAGVFATAFDLGRVLNPTSTVALTNLTIKSASQVATGTAQTGSTASIQLAAGSSAVDGTYDPSLIRLIGGTGAGQARLIVDYNGTSKVAIVDRNWRTNPDNTTVYEILSATNLISTNEGQAAGGGASTITLNSMASTTDDTYTGETIVLRAGPGEDQSRTVVAYAGATKIASVSPPWVTQPTNSTVYIMNPVGPVKAVANPVGVSSFSGLVGVSSITTPVGVSSISVGVNASTVSGLVGVSTNNDKTGYALTSAERAAIADRLLGRNVSSGGDGGRTVSEAFYVLRNKVDATAGIVYATDDTTSSWGFSVSTMAGNPIVQIDPA